MNKHIRIIPAILTEDPAALEKMLRLSESFTNYVQIDVMDGRFVPSKSINWKDIAKVKTKLKWEAHLMVKEPQKELAEYQKAGAFRAIFHFEASSSPESVIALARQLSLEIGMAINPETAVSQILPLTEKLDSLLFMSVHPGFYGAKYLPEVLTKVRELRQARPYLEIAIDGGIKESNILDVAKSGVDGICVGSAIFLQPDPAASFARLQIMVNQL
jgi:ribulose-phosphate 3-epimerase